jgi:predicted PurR-regulated permease PerM
MNTLVLIISVLGGVHAFGFIGIVLGPVVAAVLTALVETYAKSPEPEVPAAPVALPVVVSPQMAPVESDPPPPPAA